MNFSSALLKQRYQGFATFAACRRCFDNHGNYTLGVSDQSIFPEVELDKIKRNIGFDVTIVTTARTDEEAKSLLSEMGMPFSDRARKPAAQPA
jgi:large subunit ribosomal protein L5